MSDCLAGGLVHPATLVAFLERAGVTKSSIVRVTGPSALSALLWLCRHGYQQVGYVRAAQGAPHTEDPDAIIVAHTCGELALKHLLDLGRLVHPGGAFIFQLRTHPQEDAASGIEWMLEQAGFHLEARLDGGRRALLVARRKALPMSRAA